MSKEIEIEYKAMLTKEQFNNVLAHFPFPKQPIQQTNHYFETTNFALKAANAALRIREINNQYVITLKQKMTNHVLETHDTIDTTIFHDWINGRITFATETGKSLAAIGIQPLDLQYVGALTTRRYTFTKDAVTYCLDESEYANITDYELEIEESSFGRAKDIFHEIINQFAIDNVESVTKIARFSQAIQ